MKYRRAPALSVAKKRAHNGYWLDHAEIGEADFEWLASVERLILWNVSVPPGFLARLEKLWWLDVRGGSASDLQVARGCARLQYLEVNQVRGMRDLSVVSEMVKLRYISLYGLPRVTELPSLSPLSQLEHASVGQMRGLLSLRAVLEAPHLRQLQLQKNVNVTPEDVKRITAHPTMKQFSWSVEDVPIKVWRPVVDRISLPPVPTAYPEEWFGLPPEPWMLELRQILANNGPPQSSASRNQPAADG